MNILILNGHDDFGNGGVYNKKYGTEQYFTRDFAKSLKTALEQFSHTVTIYNPSCVDKSMYTYLVNGGSFDFTRYDYTIELHFNAGVNDLAGNGVKTGTEILIHSNVKDITVPSIILNALSNFGIKSRGIKRRTDLCNMNYCYKQKANYLLWEVCFFDDEDDMQYYINNKDKLANVFAKSLNNKIEESELYYATVMVEDDDTLNIRNTKDYSTNTNIIGRIPPNTFIRVLEKDGEWCKIEYSGIVGYVVGVYLYHHWVGSVIAKDGLNVRKHPGTEKGNEPILALSYGTKVHIFKFEYDKTGVKWYQIGTDINNIIGYSHSLYLK